MASTPAQIIAKMKASLQKQINTKNTQIDKYEAKKMAKQVLQAGYVSALLTETVAKKIAALNKKNDAATQSILTYANAVTRLTNERLELSQALAALNGPV
jgi:predicted  nucleic acid-binding Zn-ribbon protein